MVKIKRFCKIGQELQEQQCRDSLMCHLNTLNDAIKKDKDIFIEHDKDLSLLLIVM